ncbi:MAG: type II toxin-antitoxin system RelE family toxin [Rhodoglobus sp.]
MALGLSSCVNGFQNDRVVVEILVVAHRRDAYR